MEKDNSDKLICVLCGAPWEPGCKNVCECGGFSTWGYAKGGPPSSWDVHEDGSWTPKPVPKDYKESKPKELILGNRKIPTNVADKSLLVLKREITFKQLELEGFRDHCDGLGMFTGAYVQSPEGTVYMLALFDSDHEGEYSGIEIRTNHNIYLKDKRNEILRALGLTLADVAWESPDVEQQIKDRRRTTWRLRIQYALLLGLLAWQPYWFLVTYCAIAYAVVLWLIVGGTITGNTTWSSSLLMNIIWGGIVIALAPIYFFLLILFFAFRPPIL